jgi:hypothetical protein
LFEPEDISAELLDTCGEYFTKLLKICLLHGKNVAKEGEKFVLYTELLLQVQLLDSIR